MAHDKNRAHPAASFCAATSGFFKFTLKKEKTPRPAWHPGADGFNSITRAYSALRFGELPRDWQG